MLDESVRWWWLTMGIADPYEDNQSEDKYPQEDMKVCALPFLNVAYAFLRSVPSCSSASCVMVMASAHKFPFACGC